VFAVSRTGDGEVGHTTPPPPRRDSFAALTIEVAARVVIEVRIRETLELRAADGCGSGSSSSSTL